MNTYVALVRGLNVGGRAKLRMDELRALFAALGHADVTTYIQSGNVVFKSPVDRPSELAHGVEERIAGDLALPVTVLVRTRDELAQVVRGNPFLDRRADVAKLHVTFLAAVPDAVPVRELNGQRFDRDELRVVGREVYLHCPDGYGRTKLSNTFLERRLGVAATTRNWKTVTTLLELADR